MIIRHLIGQCVDFGFHPRGSPDDSTIQTSQSRNVKRTIYSFLQFTRKWGVDNIIRRWIWQYKPSAGSNIMRTVLNCQLSKTAVAVFLVGLECSFLTKFLNCYLLQHSASSNLSSFNLICKLSHFSNVSTINSTINSVNCSREIQQHYYEMYAKNENSKIVSNYALVLYFA